MDERSEVTAMEVSCCVAFVSWFVVFAKWRTEIGDCVRCALFVVSVESRIRKQKATEMYTRRVAPTSSHGYLSWLQITTYISGVLARCSVNHSAPPTAVRLTRWLDKVQNIIIAACAIEGFPAVLKGSAVVWWIYWWWWCWWVMLGFNHVQRHILSPC